MTNGFQGTFKRLSREASLFKNMTSVISKMNKDDGLNAFYGTINEIFATEMKFTYNGNLD